MTESIVANARRQWTRAVLLASVAVAGLLCAFAADAASEPDAAKLELARRYLDARSDLAQMLLEIEKPQPLPDRSTFEQMIDEMMPVLSASREWTPAHENWAKARAILSADLAELFSRIENERRSVPASDVLDRIVQARLASELNTDDLERIVTFYESSTGSGFIKAHTRLFDMLVSIWAQRQPQETMRAASGGAHVDATQLNTLIGLLDEVVMLQTVILDQGQGERANLQSIPRLMASTVQNNFDRFFAIWNELAPDQRQASLVYRESAVAARERGALREAFGEVAALTKTGAIMDRVIETIARATEKLHGSVPQ